MKEFKNNLYLYFNFAYGIKDLVLLSKTGKYISQKFQELDNSNSSLEQKIINIYANSKQYSVSNTKEQINLKSFQPERGYYSSYLSDINNFIIKYDLNQYADFIIFGSMATEDYVTEFSDTDIIMLLKDELFSSPKKIKWFKKRIHELNGLLLRIDPLQDHGIFTVLPSEINNYDQSVNIPLTVLKKGFNLGNKDLEITFSLSDELNIDSHQVLESYLNLSLSETEVVINNIRFFRNLLHRVYLLPAFYLQAKGRHCYKKESFSLIKDDNRFEIINQLSLFYNEKFYPRRGFRVLPRILFKKSPLLVRIFLEKLYGKKKQNFMSVGNLKENVSQFRSLLKNIKQNG